MAGLSTAIGLQKQKLPFTLYEKAPEITYEEVGLGISHNMYPVLAEWGLLKRSQSIGSEIRHLRMVNKNGKILRSLRIKQPALTVDRSKFYEILASEIPSSKIQLNTSRSFEDFPAEEVVIAAEGALSPSRRKLYPHIPLRQSRQTLWRGIANLKLDPSYHQTYVDFIGAPLRFAIIHTVGNLYSWYLIGENLSPEVKEAPEVKNMLLNLLHDYAPLTQEIIRHTGKIYRTELMDLDPDKRKGLNWYAGNMVMIGDAIHPTTPNMANGACLAMEDAYVLSKLLRQNNQKPSAAFPIYQKLREPKVNTIVKRSWALGQMMHPRNQIMNSLMLASTRIMPQKAFDLIYAGVLNDESLRQVNKQL